MKLLTLIKPDFWDHEDVAAGASPQRFSLRRLWITLVLATVTLVIGSSLVIMLIDTKLNRQAVESEIRAQTLRMVSAAGRQVAAFIAEHKNALDIVAPVNTPAVIKNPARLQDILDHLNPGSTGDVLLINREGTLQTSSRHYGNVLQKIQLAVPANSESVQVYETRDTDNSVLSVGYAYIADTPFILMLIRSQDELLRPWMSTRKAHLGLLTGLIIVMLLLILGGVTYLVKHLHTADHRRVVTLHEVEYAHKMASLGRLSAGVAHEINNPLAIINEKAGLIKDLFTIGRQYSGDSKLMGLIDSIIFSVDRCARVTRRLLNFARHIDIKPRSLHIGEVIHEVLSFLGKDAEYRSIQVVVDVPPDIPVILSDRGRIQEIFLNLLNNSYAAMSDGGRLKIGVRSQPPNFIEVTVGDNGRGIPQEDLKRIFEPFFSARVKGGGTGLGLSITYGLVKEIGGTICVDSEIGKGTRFTVVLPLKFKDGDAAVEGTYSRW